MRSAIPTVLALLALVTGLAALALVLTRADDPGAPASGDGDLATRIDALERRIDSLERARPPRSGRAATTPAAAAPGPSRPAAPVRPLPSFESDDTGPTFLARWIASFDVEPHGSAFFRMAVVAYAQELRDDLATVAGDPARPEALRLECAKMLAGPTFRGDPVAVEALLGVLRSNPPNDLAEAAIEGLAQCGDAGTAAHLEAVAPTLTSGGARASLYPVMARLAGPNANAAILRLLAREESPGVQARLVASLNARDETTALAVIEQASRRERQVRNRGAEKIALFNSPEARALLDTWLAREEERSVKARLRRSRMQQDEVPKYGAARVAGPADVANPNGDDVNAWCPKEQDGGREWLELTYPRAIVATAVHVHEVFTPGAVAEVWLAPSSGSFERAWAGEDPLERAGVFEVPVADVGFAAQRVRVVLDTARRKGWHEIDAVELVGADDRAWAVTVKASSTWGED